MWDLTPPSGPFLHDATACSENVMKFSSFPHPAVDLPAPSRVVNLNDLPGNRSQYNFPSK